MSMGFLVPQDAPIAWRGLMVQKAMNQLLFEVAWPKLDLLVLDLPPGTGDVQLTITQSVLLDGAIVVSTPQDLALLDARKGVEMFRKVNIPVLGVVENMAVHICSNCGHAEHLFGEGGGEKLATQYGVELLASLPLASVVTRSSRPRTPVTKLSSPKCAASTSSTTPADSTSVRLLRRALR